MFLKVLEKFRERPQSKGGFPSWSPNRRILQVLPSSEQENQNPATRTEGPEGAHRLGATAITRSCAPARSLAGLVPSTSTADQAKAGLSWTPGLQVKVRCEQGRFPLPGAPALRDTH